MCTCITKKPNTTDYSQVVRQVIQERGLSRSESLEILKAPNSDMQIILEKTRQVREHFFGRQVKLCMLKNAQSGHCSEDCHYCSQSKISEAKIEQYSIVSPAQIVQAAERAREIGAGRLCVATSGSIPSEMNLQKLCEAAEKIKACWSDLELCVSVGMLSLEQAQALKHAGVDWVNHNLNTSENYYPEICTTHQFRDRIQTAQHIKAAGLNLCAGGIVGLGETPHDLVDMAFTLRDVGANAIPLNFLYPVPGTPFAKRSAFDPNYGLKALAMMRLVNPTVDIRMAAGRELYLNDRQYLVLFAATSIFIAGYLTTPGQDEDEARKMITDAGFYVVKQLERKNE